MQYPQNVFFPDTKLRPVKFNTFKVRFLDCDLKWTKHITLLQTVENVRNWNFEQHAHSCGCALSLVLHMILSDTREGKINLQRKNTYKRVERVEWIFRLRHLFYFKLYRFFINHSSPLSEILLIALCSSK